MTDPAKEAAPRIPTQEDQARARRTRVAQELGIHPSRIPQEHADELFGKLGTPFMTGYKQTLRARAPTRSPHS